MIVSNFSVTSSVCTLDSDSDSNSDEAVHYGIDGRKIPSDVPGLHIIKYKNGIEGKVWIR